jgi:hypothetical protein
MPDLEKIRELEPEVISEKKFRVVWTPDLVDNEGDKDCDHKWVNGREFIQTDKDGKALTERILPRICSVCERKEFLFEHTNILAEKEEDRHPYIALQARVKEKIKLQPKG